MIFFLGGSMIFGALTFFVEKLERDDATRIQVRVCVCVC